MSLASARIVRATYTVSAGTTRPGQAAFPNQAASNRNGISQGAQYLFAGTSSDVTTTVPARYLTLTYQVPCEENVCVQEFRVFSPASAQQAGSPELGSDLSTLLKAAISGAKVGNPAGNQLLIQLHIDRGGDNATATDFFTHMRAAGVPFDVIGLSYYPWYHGPMSAMKANLTALIEHFHTYVMISEDQFPQNAIGGYGQYDPADANYPDTLPGYLVTPAGQASYQRDLVSLMASLPDHKGLGVFYWDSYSYQGMFTYPGIAQPVIDAYQIGTTPTAGS